MLHWTREHDGRFYTAFICKDLFQDWVVVKAWGSKGKPKAQRQIIVCKDKDEAISVLAEITLRRKKRNYRLVELCSIYADYFSKAANNEHMLKTSDILNE